MLFRSEPAADAAAPRDEAQDTGRALVPVEPQPRESGSARIVRHRVDAAFLTQLIATRDDLPDTRRLRRAEPRRVARLYDDAMEGGSGLLTPGWLVDARL